MSKTAIQNRSRAIPSPALQPAADAAEPSRRSHPGVAAVTSALLLWFAFPPADRGYLAWFALAPLFLLARREDSPKRLYGGAWLGGLLFWLLAVEWIRLADESAWVAWLALAAILSLWWPLFLALARLATRRLKLPLMVAAPIIWVGLEYARTHLFTGFPWYNLAHSQYRYLPLIQISDLTGAWGLSWLIAIVNTCWVDFLTLPLRRGSSRGFRLARSQTTRGLIVTALFVANLAYGWERLATARFRPGPRVAVIQTDLEQKYKNENRDPNEMLNSLETLVAKAAMGPPRPDLVIWPETSFPFGFTTIDPAISESLLTAQARAIDPELTSTALRKDLELSYRRLHEWADATNVAMLVGTSEHVFAAGGPYRYNSSILFEPRNPRENSYHKQHLVPFGEYLPLSEALPWLVVFTPYEGDRVPHLDAGRSSAVLRLGSWRIAAAICFEDTVPHVVRRAFTDRNQQPDLLVNQSNDGWFQGSSEHEAHLAISVFRAVENRVPIARSANRGISALIDGNGKILATIPKLRAEVLTHQIPLDDRVSAYSLWGDWWGLACLAVTIGLIPQAVFRHFRDSPRATNSPFLPKPLS
jgi:apolipoprotein N-acyltransferase